MRGSCGFAGRMIRRGTVVRFPALSSDPFSYLLLIWWLLCGRYLLEGSLIRNCAGGTVEIHGALRYLVATGTETRLAPRGCFSLFLSVNLSCPVLGEHSVV
jgi:hypothetical protein